MSTPPQDPSLTWRFSACLASCFFRSASRSPRHIANILAYVLFANFQLLSNKLKIRSGLGFWWLTVDAALLIGEGTDDHHPAADPAGSRVQPEYHQWLEQGAQSLQRQNHHRRVVIAADLLEDREPVGGFLQPDFGTTLMCSPVCSNSIVWIVFIVITPLHVKDEARSWPVRKPGSARLRGNFNRLVEELNTIWSAFFRGQLLLALSVTLISPPRADHRPALALLMGRCRNDGIFPRWHGVWLVTACCCPVMGSTHLPSRTWYSCYWY